MSDSNDIANVTNYLEVYLEPILPTMGHRDIVEYRKFWLIRARLFDDDSIDLRATVMDFQDINRDYGDYSIKGNIKKGPVGISSIDLKVANLHAENSFDISLTGVSNYAAGSTVLMPTQNKLGGITEYGIFGIKLETLDFKLSGVSITYRHNVVNYNIVEIDPSPAPVTPTSHLYL